MIGLGLSLMMGSLYRWYCATPRTVELEEDGMTMHMASGRSKTVDYGDIACMQYEPADPTKKGERGLGSSAVYLKGKEIPRIFTAEIGTEIREAYKRKYGKYPPRRG